MKSESDVHLWKVKVIVTYKKWKWFWLWPMKSEDTIFFYKNVEASISVVPRMLSLFLPEHQHLNMDNEWQWWWFNHNMMRRRRKKKMMKITLSLWVDHRVAPLAQEAEGSPQEHLCGIFRWELKQEDEQKKDGVDGGEDNLALRVTEVSTFPLPSLLT